jgi:hypothetical protein
MERSQRMCIFCPDDLTRLLPSYPFLFFGLLVLLHLIFWRMLALLRPYLLLFSSSLVYAMR